MVVRRVIPHFAFTVLTALAVVSCCAFSLAQQPGEQVRHRRIAPGIEKRVQSPVPATSRSMVGGLWMTDANYKSSIYLRNVVETDPITVTPILYLSNGKSYTLPNVTVEPAGTAIVDINDGLRRQGISSWATLHGHVKLQYKWPWDPARRYELWTPCTA